MALCLCVFTACEKDEPVIPDEPVVPPTEQPEEPETPVEPEEPQEPISTDGIINWNNEFIIVGDNNMANIGSGTWNYIAYGNGKYVVAGEWDKYTSYENGCITTSTDGVNWTDLVDLGQYGCDGIAYGNGKFVVPQAYKISYSTDGINWTTITPDINIKTEHGIAFGNGKFVRSSSGSISYSVDGINWTNKNMRTGDIYFCNGNFYMSHSYSDTEFYISSNGIDWDTLSFPEETSIFGIAYGNGKYIIVGGEYNGSAIFTSTDGRSWSKETIGYSGVSNLTGIAFSNGKFVVCSTSGWLYTSPDGSNWSRTIRSRANSIFPVQ